MGQRRYAADYRLEEYVTPKGDVQTRRVYQGATYRFCRKEADVQQDGKKLCLISALCFAGLLPILFNNTQIGRTVYVLLPIAFTLIPVYHVAAAGVRMQKYESPLTRQQRDLTDRRLKSGSVGLTVMLGLDSAGCLAYWIVKGLERAEWLPIAGILTAFLLSLLILRMQGAAGTEAMEETNP